jgi:acetylornithine/N-succinyldiaminopimelate aminotransferase
MSPTSQQRYAAALMNTFGPPQLVLSRGKGARVWDDEGNEYVDLVGGIAVNALGHAHPAIVEAVTAQLSTLGHVSNLFATVAQITLAERLLELVALHRVGESAFEGSRDHDGRVFFTSSGAEANEAAIKLTRRTGRTHLVAAEGSFHGRTMGALALTATAAYREPFEPLPGNVTVVPYGDPDALASAVTEATAAVVLEPIRARPAWSSRHRGTWPRRAAPPGSAVPCSGSTRCRPASAAPAAGCAPPATPTSRPTW